MCGCHPRRGPGSRCSRSKSAGSISSRSIAFSAPICYPPVAMDTAQTNTIVEAPRFGHRLEAWGASAFFAAFGLLPLDCASALGGALARRIGPFLGISKRARLNLRRAFPELSETEIARVVAGMWDILGRVAGEYPHLQKIRVFEPVGRVETRGLDHVDRAV